MSTKHQALARVALAANLTTDETIMAPSVLSGFARGLCTEDSMLRELGENAELRDYFAEVCRTVAASPEGREVVAGFRGEGS